jgi:hypothetical protein
MVASSGIGNLGIEIHLCLPSIERTFPPKGDLNGEGTYLIGYTFLIDVIVLGGDNTLGAFCMTAIEGLILDVV